jgi:hypothetical protein
MQKVQKVQKVQNGCEDMASALSALPAPQQRAEPLAAPDSQGEDASMLLVTVCPFGGVGYGSRAIGSTGEEEANPVEGSDAPMLTTGAAETSILDEKAPQT